MIDFLRYVWSIFVMSGLINSVNFSSEKTYDAYFRPQRCVNSSFVKDEKTLSSISKPKYSALSADFEKRQSNTHAIKYSASEIYSYRPSASQKCVM